MSDIAGRADEEYARGSVTRIVTDAEVARLAAAVARLLGKSLPRTG